MFWWVLFLAVVGVVYVKWPKKTPAKSLKGKVVIITGGGSGIGRSLVEECAARNAEGIVLVGRRLERLEQTAKELSITYPHVQTLCLSADCSLQDDCKQIIYDTIAKFNRIDIMIINHAFGRVQKLREIPESELTSAFRDTYDSNVLGTMMLVYYGLPHLEQSSSGGHILHISSLSAFHAVPKCSLYSSSKIAIHRFYDCLRMELGKKSELCISIASPGLVRTDTAASYVPEQDMKGAMDSRKCAKLCLDGMSRREREIFLNLIDSPPIPGWLVYYIATLFPQLMEQVQYWAYDFEKGEGIKDAILEKPKTARRLF